MNLTDEQLRQVRVWSIETALGRAAMTQTNPLLPDLLMIAGELVDFVTADQAPTAPRR